MNFHFEKRQIVFEQNISLHKEEWESWVDIILTVGKNSKGTIEMNPSLRTKNKICPDLNIFNIFAKITID